jgi:hypothetical protein
VAVLVWRVLDSITGKILQCARVDSASGKREIILSPSLPIAGRGFSLDGLSFHHANDAKPSVRLHSPMERWNGRHGQREGFPSLKAIIAQPSRFSRAWWNHQQQL